MDYTVVGMRPFPLLLLDEKDQAEGPTQAPDAVDSTPRLAIKDVDVGGLLYIVRLSASDCDFLCAILGNMEGRWESEVCGESRQLSRFRESRC